MPKVRKEAKLTSKGQITVPRDIRRLLGVGPGDRLVFENSGETSRFVRSARQVYSRNIVAQFLSCLLAGAK